MNILRIVWLAVRRITNLIRELKGYEGEYFGGSVRTN